MRTLLERQIRPAVTVLVVLMVVTGLIYPGIVTAIAQALFPRQANGSLVVRRGAVVGSGLIGQAFSRPGYFHPRPSMAGAGYDDTLSGGSNLGPTSARLADTLIARRIDSVIATDGAARGRIPSDMVTASGSGLDPDISPADAALQEARVAKARGVPIAAVRALVARFTDGPQVGLFGDARVNVLRLNLALDSALAGPRPPLP